MTLLLTILSVVAVWALLAVLALGLLLIRKPLETARRRLEQIAMGVRAIEKQTAPIAPRAEAIADSLHRASEALDGLARHGAGAPPAGSGERAFRARPSAPSRAP